MGNYYIQGHASCARCSGSYSALHTQAVTEGEVVTMRIRVQCTLKLHVGAVLKPLFTFYIKPEHVRSKISAFLWSRKIRESTAKGPAKGQYNVCQHRCYYRRQMKLLWVFLGPRKTAKGPRKARREGGFEVKEYWTTPMWVLLIDWGPM